MHKRALLQLIRKNAFKHQMVAFDTETTGLEPYFGPTYMKLLDGRECKAKGGRVFGVSLCDTELHTVFTRVDEPEFSVVRQILYSRKIRKIAHNYAFDKVMCDVSKIAVRGLFDDTMLMARLLVDWMPAALKFLARTILQEDTQSELAIKTDLKRRRSTYTRAGRPKGYVNYSFVEPALMEKYAADDARYTMLLFLLWKTDVIRQFRFLYNLDKTMAGICIRLTHKGLHVDIARLEQLHDECQTHVAGWRQILLDAAAEHGLPDFKPGSPKQMAEFLAACGIPDVYLHAGKKASVDAKTLLRLDDDRQLKIPELGAVLRYRKASKLLSTYIKPLLERAKQGGGIVHPLWRTGGAKTGRFSCDHPSVQNQKKVKVGPDQRYDIPIDIRTVYVPASGCVLLYGDHSQIELRYLAADSQDPALLKAYREGLDIHQQAANDLGTERWKAKNINFGVTYGEGAAGVAADLGIPFAEADAIIRGWYEARPGVQELKNRREREIRERGYVEDMFGRRYHIPQKLAYKGINAAIQGGCATILKINMKAVWRDARLRQIAPLILTVHDELGFEIPRSDLSRSLVKYICRRMEHVRQFTQHGVGLVVEIKIADASWSKAEAYNAYFSSSRAR